MSSAERSSEVCVCGGKKAYQFLSRSSWKHVEVKMNTPVFSLWHLRSWSVGPVSFPSACISILTPPSSPEGSREGRDTVWERERQRERERPQNYNTLCCGKHPFKLLERIEKQSKEGSDSPAESTAWESYERRAKRGNWEKWGAMERKC